MKVKQATFTTVYTCRIWARKSKQIYANIQGKGTKAANRKWKRIVWWLGHESHAKFCYLIEKSSTLRVRRVFRKWFLCYLIIIPVISLHHTGRSHKDRLCRTLCVVFLFFIFFLAVKIEVIYLPSFNLDALTSLWANWVLIKFYESIRSVKMSSGFQESFFISLQICFWTFN